MQRRTRTARRPTSSFRWLGWIAGLVALSCLVLVLLAPSLVTRYIRSYLRTEECRQKAEEMISARLGGKAHLAPIVWSDDTATITDVSLSHGGNWSIDSGGIHLALDFGAIRNGSWRIQNAGADDLKLRRVFSTAAPPPSASSAAQIEEGAEADAIPPFLRRYLPFRTEVSGFDVHRFFFETGTATSAWKVADAQMHIGAWSSGEKSVPAKLDGGTLQTPISLPEQKELLKLDIAKATVRLGEDQVLLSDATLRWKQDAEATLRGSFNFGGRSWQIFTHLKAVPLDEFLNAWWRQRLSGKIEGDLEMSGRGEAAPAWKADAVLKNGVLSGLPLLDKLAAYTKADRFKRLVLDICQASFRPQGEGTMIEKIIVQSNGLLRIEGSMMIRGRAIEGDFMLGVTPETLRWIPGAESRVFVQNNPNGPPGLQWTRVRIAGTLDAPQEDLSARLIGAAGMSLLFDTPNKIVNQGAEALIKPVLGDGAAKLPGSVIQSTGSLIDNGIKEGTDAMKKILPVFPGK